MIAPGNSWKEQGVKPVFSLWSAEPYIWPFHFHLQGSAKYSCRGRSPMSNCQTAQSLQSPFKPNFLTFLQQRPWAASLLPRSLARLHSPAFLAAHCGLVICSSPPDRTVNESIKITSRSVLEKLACLQVLEACSLLPMDWNANIVVMKWPWPSDSLLKNSLKGLAWQSSG